MLGDNTQAGQWAREKMITNGNRFIERQYFKVAEAVDRGDVEPRWIPTDLNLADVLTKPVSRQVMEKIGPMLNGKKPLPDMPPKANALKSRTPKLQG